MALRISLMPKSYLLEAVAVAVPRLICMIRSERLCLILFSAPGSQSIGPSAITYSFNNESEGTQDFSNATIKIERCSCASTSRVRVGVIASSFNNKGNGIQNFSNATIIIIGNCCGSLGLHGITFHCFFLRVLVTL
ncbi:hypothetical protein VNO80_16480 [Phaseolus coccineus]|uniref:Uncharacterized protein n=1 Tax=Phaseolus coccineus TaxID=3886 RepID=A0AAN9R2S4_PHACN